MLNTIKISFIISVLLLTGCAHQIQLNPQMDKFAVSENKIDKVVGYHISTENIAKKVTTPGGGGDKISYFPYKETEAVLYTVLTNKFKDVYSVSDVNDKNFLKEKDIYLIFIPEIVTNSSSNSLFTWPPTSFTYSLTLKAINNENETFWEKRITAEGKAEYGEFKSDFSLSARRATEEVFLQLAEELDLLTLK